MNDDTASLRAALQENPGDWSTRIALAEALKEEGRREEAVAVLRENPLTPITQAQSARARELLEELDPKALAPEDVSGPVPEMAGDVMAPISVTEAVDDDEPVVVAEAIEDWDDEEEAAEYGEFSEYGGEYEEGDFGGDHQRVFIVGEGELVHPHERESVSAQKVSALTIALLAHVAVLAMLGFVVISMPRPNPPQVVATLNATEAEDFVEEVKIQRINRSVSSAMASSTPVVSAVGASPVAVPEFAGTTTSLDVTLGAVSANVGTGMSFEATESESMVNFFGIKSKGSRMVFVIEAARFMLTDNKGGIPAYDKVKEDLGKMLAGLNRLTAFNIILFDHKKIATFRDDLVPASPSNVRLGIEWLDPINRVYEEIGIRSDYSSKPLLEGVEPIKLDDLSHFVKAVQRAMEMDINTVFLLTSGWVHLHKPMDERELAKFYKDHKWDEDTEKEWQAAVKQAHAWLDKENAARRAKGVPQRVIRDWHELVAELAPSVRRKPSPGYLMEEVEEQLKNSARIYYRNRNKDRPKINVVWFIGEDEEPSVTVDSHFNNIARDSRGKTRILQGLEGLKNVTGGPK